MNRSHPGRWIFGGVLEQTEWHAGRARVRLWSGEEADVDDGDTVTMLRTPTHVQIVEVQESAA